jgi:hypothetical protein
VKCTLTYNISTTCNRLCFCMWVLTVYSDILCKQLHFKIVAVVILPILCVILDLYFCYGFLSYDLVMAPLKMVNKHRNMMGQPHWRVNVLTNLCISRSNKSVKLKIHSTEPCKFPLANSINWAWKPKLLICESGFIFQPTQNVHALTKQWLLHSNRSLRPTVQ